MPSRFPVAFRPTGIRFLVILSRQGVEPSSRSADQTDGLDPDGVSTFHTHETRPGWVPSRPRDGGALPTGGESPVGTRRFSTASPQPLHCTPSRGAQHNGASSRIHGCSPVRSFPLPVTPGWRGSPWASPRSFAPRRYQRRTSGRGRALSTGPGLRCQHHLSALLPARPLKACDLVSHFPGVVGEEHHAGVVGEAQHVGTAVV